MTHSLAGAAAARIVLARPLGRSAWLPGAVGALAPDLDALIRSAADPLLYAEFHRHFTHSLLFIPAGGALAALPWMIWPHARARWKAYLGAATVGYATHGPLDASTTYGTLLLWPFSDVRVAWNVISIVDPLFTLVLLAGVLAALWRGSARPAALALILCLGYLALGAGQRQRALEAQGQLAVARGHEPVRAQVFPGFGTQVIWRSLYEVDEVLYMDRLRVPWWGEPTWRPGTIAARVREADLAPEIRHDARMTRDFRRFRWFSDGWTARAPGQPGVIGDARYSDALDRFEPVWGVRFRPGASPPVEWVDRSRDRRVDPPDWWREVRGRDPAYRPLP